jgi:methylated-DNA-[protein]-cysteine S-methyltransferase
MIFTTTLETPVGALALFATDQGLRYVAWPQAMPPAEATDGAVEAPEHPALRHTSRQLAEYFSGRRTAFDVPLDPQGTPFQREAWEYLCEIPYGATRTYGQQAAAIGRPKAARAVGGANGRNPLSIIVPCHRVVGADGSLTGFAGGVSIKRFLLAHEATVYRRRAPG